LQTNIDTFNLARMPVNAGTTGQEAIMARLAPQIERQDASTRQRLANQGLVPGGEAYENAMISQNQQKNDLVDAGCVARNWLDTGANAQGYNEGNCNGSQNAAAQAESATTNLFAPAAAKRNTGFDEWLANYDAAISGLSGIKYRTGAHICRSAGSWAICDGSIRHPVG
jgi:hypothetical protein